MKITYIAPRLLATLAHSEVTSFSVLPLVTDPAIKTFDSPHWIYVNREIVIEHKTELEQDRQQTLALNLIYSNES